MKTFETTHVGVGVGFSTVVGTFWAAVYRCDDAASMFSFLLHVLPRQRTVSTNSKFMIKGFKAHQNLHQRELECLIQAHNIAPAANQCVCY